MKIASAGGSPATAMTPSATALSRQVTQAGSTLTTRCQYDSNDRLLSEDSDGLITTYSWDANGNLLKKPPDGNSTTYGWDSHNRLIRVDTGSQTTEYERDAQGQRVKTRVTVGGKTVETLHLIDEARPYAEVVLDKTGSSETRYLHTPDGLGELIAEQSGSQTRLYHADGQGSTRLVTDPAQSIQEILSFDAFGKRTDAFGQTADALSTIHRQYVGEYADHTGLYNLRARHYDPQLGRFVSMDEFAGRLTQPLSLNKYGYAHGDPIGGQDPSGRMTLGE
ncbi:MAG: RHS repeat-associated core domain-containing protein [Uliginosibacterium sp.]|nr:RHS repeat-associated core domain-containing protein [Uliginosibacterium sp.]